MTRSLLYFLTVSLLLIAGSASAQDVLEQHHRIMVSAIARGDLATVKKMLNTPYVTVDDPYTTGGPSFFFYAVIMGQDDIVEYMLTKGAKVTTPLYQGQTALFLAAGNCRESIIRILLKALTAEAPKNRVEYLNLRSENEALYGYTVLMQVFNTGMPCQDHQLAETKMLVEAGADVNLVSGNTGVHEYTALGLAKSHAKQEVLDYLISKGAKCIQYSKAC